MVKEKHMRKEMKKKLTAKAKRSTAVVLTFLMVFMSVHWDGISFNCSLGRDLIQRCLCSAGGNRGSRGRRCASVKK